MSERIKRRKRRQTKGQVGVIRRRALPDGLVDAGTLEAMMLVAASSAGIAFWLGRSASNASASSKDEARTLGTANERTMDRMTMQTNAREQQDDVQMRHFEAEACSSETPPREARGKEERRGSFRKRKEPESRVKTTLHAFFDENGFAFEALETMTRVELLNASVASVRRIAMATDEEEEMEDAEVVKVLWACRTNAMRRWMERIEEESRGGGGDGHAVAALLADDERMLLTLTNATMKEVQGGAESQMLSVVKASASANARIWSGGGDASRRVAARCVGEENMCKLRLYAAALGIVDAHVTKAFDAADDSARPRANMERSASPSSSSSSSSLRNMAASVRSSSATQYSGADMVLSAHSLAMALDDLAVSIADAIATDFLSLARSVSRRDALSPESILLEKVRRGGGSSSSSSATRHDHTSGDGDDDVRGRAVPGEHTPSLGRVRELLDPCLHSTRSFERFVNMLAFTRWYQSRVMSVAAIFEDRFELWSADSSGKLSLHHVRACRIGEQRELTGWRYAISLALELADVLAPAVAILVSRIGSALSFFLVALIGRSLGLVWKGVRNAVDDGAGDGESRDSRERWRWWSRNNSGSDNSSSNAAPPPPSPPPPSLVPSLSGVSLSSRSLFHRPSFTICKCTHSLTHSLSHTYKPLTHSLTTALTASHTPAISLRVDSSPFS